MTDRRRGVTPQYCYGCYRDLELAPGWRWTVAGFLVCNWMCMDAALKRWRSMGKAGDCATYPRGGARG